MQDGNQCGPRAHRLVLAREVHVCSMRGIRWVHHPHKLPLPVVQIRPPAHAAARAVETIWCSGTRRRHCTGARPLGWKAVVRVQPESRAEHAPQPGRARTISTRPEPEAWGRTGRRSKTCGSARRASAAPGPRERPGGSRRCASTAQHVSSGRRSRVATTRLHRGLHVATK